MTETTTIKDKLYSMYIVDKYSIHTSKSRKVIKYVPSHRKIHKNSIMSCYYNVTVITKHNLKTTTKDKLC